MVLLYMLTSRGGKASHVSKIDASQSTFHAHVTGSMYSRFERQLFLYSLSVFSNVPRDRKMPYMDIRIRTISLWPTSEIMFTMNGCL